MKNWFNYSPPHHGPDTIRTPPFSSTIKRNVATCNSAKQSLVPTSSGTSNNNKNLCSLTPQSSVISNHPQSHQLIPVSIVSTTPLTTTPTTGRLPPSSTISGKAQIVGENGIGLQTSGGGVGGNGSYPSTSSQFGHGTSVAINGGEEGNNNLMWLLDFKLDFFNDPDTG